LLMLLGFAGAAFAVWFGISMYFGGIA